MVEGIQVHVEVLWHDAKAQGYGRDYYTPMRVRLWFSLLIKL
jgi:hypothetical protein